MRSLTKLKTVIMVLESYSMLLNKEQRPVVKKKSPKKLNWGKGKIKNIGRNSKLQI